MGQHIHYEVEDGVVTITIDRPEKRNAMTYAVLADFNDAIARAVAAFLERRPATFTGR